MRYDEDAQTDDFACRLRTEAVAREALNAARRVAHESAALAGAWHLVAQTREAALASERERRRKGPRRPRRS